MASGVKLTVPSYIVLGMVKAMGEATPYDMKRLAAVSLDHFWSVRHAQLYTEPERLAAAGYLTERKEGGGRRRKLYKLTTAGEKAFAQWQAAPASELSELRDQGILKVFFGADPARTAAERIPQHEERLKEFEALMAELGDLMTDGQRLALRMGIQAETNAISGWRRVLDGSLNGDK